MKLIFAIIYLLFSSSIFATPKKVEIVFLSEPKGSSLVRPVWNPLVNISANDYEKDCVKTGDGCFHPQLGYIPDDKPKSEVVKPKSFQVKTFNSDDVNLVECREGEYFDIFCGKAKQEARLGNEVEVWIDTSASLRKMDYSADPSRCVRRSFVEKLQSDCKANKLAVMTYDTSIKLLSSNEGLCQNYGSNDIDRLIKWIKASEANYLFIVTDIDELSRELRDYLDSIGATYHGSEVKSMTVHDLDNFVSIVKKQCS